MIRLIFVTIRAIIVCTFFIVVSLIQVVFNIIKALKP